MNTVDNDSAFSSRRTDAWAYEQGIRWSSAGRAVEGRIAPILFPRVSVNHTLLSGPEAMPHG